MPWAEAGYGPQGLQLVSDIGQVYGYVDLC